MGADILGTELPRNIFNRIFRGDAYNLPGSSVQTLGEGLHGMGIQPLVGEGKALIIIELYGIGLQYRTYFRVRVQRKNDSVRFRWIYSHAYPVSSNQQRYGERMKGMLSYKTVEKF